MPSQIPLIIHLARKIPLSRTVHEMQFSDFMDFKSYSQNLRLLSVRRAMADKEVSDLNWAKLFIIRVDKENLNIFLMSFLKRLL